MNGYKACNPCPALARLAPYNPGSLKLAHYLKRARLDKSLRQEYRSAVDATLTYDGRIPEELTMDLELEVRKITEAYCISHNIPIKRVFTHDELESALAAIRQIEAAQINAAMMDILKGSAT